MKTKIQIKQIRWGYQNEPPNGLPKLLAQEVIETPAKQGAVKMENIERLIREKRPPTGYALHWTCLNAPPKRWKKEARAKVRVNKMISRIRKKYPLFDDEFITRELENDPAYYAGEQPEEQRNFIAESDAADIQAFQDAKNNIGLKIMHQWWNDA